MGPIECPAGCDLVEIVDGLPYSKAWAAWDINGERPVLWICPDCNVYWRPTQTEERGMFTHKSRCLRRANKRQRELEKQIWTMRNNHGWFSAEADAAKIRAKDFKRYKKIVFKQGYQGWLNATADAFSTSYPRRSLEWERWGRRFREDWT